MTVDIVRATADDWQQIRAVRLAGLEADPSAFGSTLERELTFTEDRWRAWPATAAVYLARMGGRPVGIGLVRGLTGENADGEINAMWVDPETRGTGVGRALLQAMLESARAGGYQSVRLWVITGNAAATTLYESLGFVRTGRTEPLLSDPQLTVVEYVLAFG